MSLAAPNKIDVKTIKDAAAGRWGEILSALGGISIDLLDGRHHPCPKCSGTDRFSMVDGEDGALLCRGCFDKKNGDGIAALMWLRGWDFQQAIAEIGDYLGAWQTPQLTNGHCNGTAKTNGKKPATMFASPEEAIADLGRYMGPHSQRWDYHDAHGKIIGSVLRWDLADGGKTIRPIALVDGRWIIGAMPEPRPLYDLPGLAGADRVYICEGEKAADAARSIGLVVTTSPHGSKSANKADWSPLAGKDVVILPDADQPGKEYADKVTEILSKLKPPAKVRVVELPGLPEKGDIVEWIDGHGDSATPESMVAEIEKMVAAEKVLGKAEPPRFVNVLTPAEFLALDLRPRFLIKDILVAGQPGVIGGRSKCLKTSIACDLVLSLASGTPFLGRFQAEQVPVAFWSGESGSAVIRETMLRQARAKGIFLEDCSFVVNFDLPKLSLPDHLEYMREVIEKRQIKVAIVDPLYLSLMSAETVGKSSDLFAMGAMLQPLTALGQDADCTFVLLHHFRKNGQVDDSEPAGLEELAQSGIAEWTRQWILLQRRSPYQADGQHELWMRAGGSAGHAGLWSLSIDEGLLDPETFLGRRWNVTIDSASNAITETKRQKEAVRETQQQEKSQKQLDGDRRRIVDAMLAYPKGETAKTIRDRSGLNSSRFPAAISSLLMDGTVLATEIPKSCRKKPYDGYRLRGENE